MVEIHLYGKLRRHAEHCRPIEDCVVMFADSAGDTLESVLAEAGIPVGEINHIFVNAKLLASRNRMASFYGYPQSGSDLSGWDLTIPVKGGDRIGLFGHDMSILGM
jgi:hypothetical protein